MRLDEFVVEMILLAVGLVSMGFYLAVGKWSDRVGRRKPILVGAVAMLVLMFPIFWAMGSLANPGLTSAAERSPVVVSGSQCTTDPFADLFDREQTECGKILEALTASGVMYDRVEAESLSLTVGGQDVALEPEWSDNSNARRAGIQAALTQQGFDFSPQTPPLANIMGIFGLVLVLAALSALTFGSVAALLSEMFPPRIRYSSMSIPYHIGAGYLGGFLPLIAGFIVARSGDLYAGLWYTWVVVAFGTVVAWWGLPSGAPTDFKERALP